MQQRLQQSGWRQSNLASLPLSLRRAANAMRTNVEEPLEIRDIALRAGLSQRQLERLFHDRLSMRPMHYYLMIRTERGRELLVYTEMPLISIAVAVGLMGSCWCGFRLDGRSGGTASALPDSVCSS